METDVLIVTSSVRNDEACWVVTSRRVRNGHEVCSRHTCYSVQRLLDMVRDYDGVFKVRASKRQASARFGGRRNA